MPVCLRATPPDVTKLEFRTKVTSLARLQVGQPRPGAPAVCSPGGDLQPGVRAQAKVPVRGQGRDLGRLWRPPTWAGALAASRPEPRRAQRQGWGGAARGRGAGRGAGPGRAVPLWSPSRAAPGPQLSQEQTLVGSAFVVSRAPKSPSNEDSLDGAVRADAPVARRLGWLCRSRALLPWPGPCLLCPWLEAGQGLRDLLLRPSLPPYR